MKINLFIKQPYLETFCEWIPLSVYTSSPFLDASYVWKIRDKTCGKRLFYIILNNSFHWNLHTHWGVFKWLMHVWMAYVDQEISTHVSNKAWGWRWLLSINIDDIKQTLHSQKGFGSLQIFLRFSGSALQNDWFPAQTLILTLTTSRRCPPGEIDIKKLTAPAHVHVHACTYTQTNKLWTTLTPTPPSRPRRQCLARGGGVAQWLSTCWRPWRTSGPTHLPWWTKDLIQLHMLFMWPTLASPSIIKKLCPHKLASRAMEFKSHCSVML